MEKLFSAILYPHTYVLLDLQDGSLGSLKPITAQQRFLFETTIYHLKQLYISNFECYRNTIASNKLSVYPVLISMIHIPSTIKFFETQIFSEKNLSLQGKRGGRIVNMNSLSGITAGGAKCGLSHYSMSKHAITGLTRNTSIEYLQEKIRVNEVAPTFIGKAQYIIIYTVHDPFKSVSLNLPSLLLSLK